MVAGPLALVGGGEWRQGCDFDVELLGRSGGPEVLIVPAAAAYEQPQHVIKAAQEWFTSLGAKVEVLPVLQRRDGEDAEMLQTVRDARFIYLADGSPLHLRSVLKDSLLWDALVGAWRSGAVLAGSSAGGMIFGDPMVDPRGGAFTLGLGLLGKFALVPHWETWTGDKARRMTSLIPKDVVVAEIEERTALIRWPDGEWEIRGHGSVTLTRDAQQISPNDIEGLIEVDPLAVTSR